MTTLRAPASIHGFGLCFEEPLLKPFTPPGHDHLSRPRLLQTPQNTHETCSFPATDDGEMAAASGRRALRLPLDKSPRKLPVRKSLPRRPTPIIRWHCFEPPLMTRLSLDTRIPPPCRPPRGKGRARGRRARGRIRPRRLRFPTLQRSPGWHCLHARVNNQPGYCDRRCCLKLDQCGTLSGAFYREFDQLHTNYAHACPMTAIKLNGVQRFQGLPLRPSPRHPPPR